VQSVDDGPGLFYETAGEMDRETVERRVREGLAAGQELRDWQFADPRAAVESRQADSGRYTTAVVPRSTATASRSSSD